MTQSPKFPLSRRSLLRKGLWGAPILLAGGALATVGAALRPGASAPTSPRPLLAFSPYEYAIFAAVAERLVPGGGASSEWPSATALDVAGKVDALIARLHPQTVKELRHLLHIFENGATGLLTVGSSRPFTRSSAEQQDARLDAWRGSRLLVLRSGYQAMKRLANAAYYSSPDIYARVGYPGPPVVQGGAG